MGRAPNGGGIPWNEAPRYMIRERDCIYGAVVTRRLRAMGIRDQGLILFEQAVHRGSGFTKHDPIACQSTFGFVTGAKLHCTAAITAFPRILRRQPLTHAVFSEILLLNNNAKHDPLSPRRRLAERRID
jgi:hypothetical protein